MQATKPGIEPENDQQRNSRTSVNGRCVFLSVKTGSVKFLSLSIRLSRSFLRLTETSCFVNLRFLAFGSSEKDDSCNKPSLSSSFVVSSFVRRHIIHF